jgi:alkanesulfonate monooxygenase SsuD/methylene tetrahydromethanopterin reductase-like flavin-dependent oxidoreductase (luciferase family)
MSRISFGWVAPVIGVPESNFVPIVMTQQEKILPAVAEHFDSVWVFDHFYGFERRTDPYLECWTTLTWLATRFPSLQVGSIVMGVGYRNPALVAKMGATLQTLSDGRLVLGLGAGWRDEEYDAYGYPFPKASVRIEQLEEAVQIIRLMWSETAPSFRGKHFKINEAYCPPQPSPTPPIMIGGSGEQLMLPLVARRADWWNTGFMDARSFQRKRDVLHRHAEAIGRNPMDIVHTFIKADRQLPNTSGDSERWLEELRPLVKLGVTHFMLDLGHVTSSEPVMRFAEEVITPLNQD